MEAVSASLQKQHQEHFIFLDLVLVPRMCDVFFKTIGFFCRVASTNTCSMSPSSGCWSPGRIVVVVVVVIAVKTCLQVTRLCS